MGFRDIKTVEEIKKTRGAVPTKVGVYKWWCKEALVDDILVRLGFQKETEDMKELLEKEGEYYCFYVGQTKGALSKRIKGQHLKRTDKSTLRRSIAALFGDEKIDEILFACALSWETIEDEKEVDKVEVEQINERLRLLNIKDVNLNKSWQKEVVSAVKDKRKHK